MIFTIKNIILKIIFWYEENFFEIYIFIVQIYFCFTFLAFRRQVRFHFFAGVGWAGLGLELG